MNKGVREMKLTSITIEYEKWGVDKGKYKSKICFDVNEDVTVYARADEIVTAELVNVLIPVFEKITNQKFEDVKGETETFLSKFGFKKKELEK